MRCTLSLMIDVDIGVQQGSAQQGGVQQGGVQQGGVLTHLFFYVHLNDSFVVAITDTKY